MRKHRKANLIRVGAFVLVTSLLSTAVAVTLSRARFDESRTYHAVFADISGLTEGSGVRASGVDVGRVKDLTLVDGHSVRVTFTAQDAVPVTSTARLRIRYANLTGDRYLDIARNPVSPGVPLADGGTIGVENTTPALDLDVLFNGFRPLLQAISPDEVNDLTSSLLAVTQGQAGAVSGLLGHVGTFTKTLATRDALIGDVIVNLDTTLGTIDENRDSVEDLIDGLDRLTDGLADDRKDIIRSLDSINTTADQTTDLLVKTRPALRDDVVQIGRVSRHVVADADYVNESLDLFPKVVSKLGRIGAYGSFYNFYICALRLKISGPGGDPVYTPFMLSKERRCQF